MRMTLGYCAMIENKEVSWMPSYGPEMRGGTANCSVNLSERRTGSPLVDKPNLLVVMNQPSLKAFAGDVVQGGNVIVDTSIIEKCPEYPGRRVVRIPATGIADEVGTPKVANVVLLGAICAATGAFPQAFVEQSLRETVKKKDLVDLNLAALRRGYEHVGDAG